MDELWFVQASLVPAVVPTLLGFPRNIGIAGLTPAKVGPPVSSRVAGVGERRNTQFSFALIGVPFCRWRGFGSRR